MVLREIIKIDEELCNGCGLCIPNCPEGAIQIIDGKARLISDLFCDGLGACIGHCPTGAIEIEKREAVPYDEKTVMANVVKFGENTIKAHLKHLQDHGETNFLRQALEYLEENNVNNPLTEETKMEDNLKCGCPGSVMREVKPENNAENNQEQSSALRQWPVQLNLLPPFAPFFNNSHLLLAADCVPFATANFHGKLLLNKSLAIGCPKLDDVQHYKEKLIEVFKQNNIKSVTVAIMEVPCCYGLYAAAQEAIKDSGKDIPLIKEVVSVSGEVS